MFDLGLNPAAMLKPSSPESWAEELRRHEHVTEQDRAAEERVLSFQDARTAPIITHLVAAHVQLHESSHQHLTKKGRMSRSSHPRA